jgi:hypothetical protein
MTAEVTKDGGLFAGGGVLPPEQVADFIAWLRDTFEDGAA